MAPKRPSHLEDPPAASSSEEEEASSEEEEGSSSSEEEEEAEAEKASSLPSTPVTEKKPASKKPDPEPQSSSSVSGFDSDTDSGATPSTSVKPIASKPMEDSTLKAATKPRSKPASSAARSSAARSSAATKRPTSETDSKDSSKRAKKKAPEPSADGIVSPDDTKKSTAGDEKKLFQRLWSEDDEIAILKGMLDYEAKRGADPIADAAAFHEFVKKSVHVDVSKAQLVDKIRRLKKKYKNNAERAKKGKYPTFSKPHELKGFELSKKIWGSTEDPNEVEPVVEAAKSNGKSPRKKSNQKGNTSRSLKEELLVALPVTKNVAEKMEIDGNQGSGPGSGSGSGRSLNGMVRFDKSMGVVGLEESVIKRGLELIGEDKRVELEERWREVEMAELEVFVKRTELVRDQARLIWEAYQKEANDH